jgi:hypothetical protein
MCVWQQVDEKECQSRERPEGKERAHHVTSPLCTQSRQCQWRVVVGLSRSQTEPHSEKTVTVDLEQSTLF